MGDGVKRLDNRLPRIKGSGDHDWEGWDETPFGRGRRCRDCGCEDDGYRQPCVDPARENPSPREA